MKKRTALITGASSGIGMEFARVLAKKRIQPYFDGKKKRQTRKAEE